MSETLVQVKDLRKIFDVSKPWLNRVLEREPKRLLTAVGGVSFDIKKGETFSLVGESGSGKSTVARMVVGLLPPTEGRITIDGLDIWDPKKAEEQRKLRRSMQMIFQDPYASLNPRMRVGEIIGEPIKTFKILESKGDIQTRVGDLLKTVGLDPRDAVKYPHEFSGGQRQRIAIARALASEPTFLVCDEPTSALDVSVQAQVLNLLRDLQDRLGLTYLFISHNMAVVKHMSSRIGVMYLGRLVEVAPTDDLFKNPLHPYSRMLLDALPDLEMTGKPRQPVKGEIPNPINPPPGCTFNPRCPLVFDRCRQEIPERTIVGNNQVACHAHAEKATAAA